MKRAFRWGVCQRTDEAIIGAASGIVGAGTVKRQAIDDAWSAEQVLAVSLTPWTVGRKSDKQELVIDDDKDVEVVKQDDADAPAVPRRLRIAKEDIEVVGYSDGCVGCSAMRAGKAAQMHSEYCQRSVEEHLLGTDGPAQDAQGRGKVH